MINLVDTIKPMADFPVAEGVDIDVLIDGTPKRLQSAIEDGDIGGGGSSAWTGTQAKFDAYDKSKLKDGQEVIITDDYDVVNGNVYSTEEVIVGKWIDGKPIYRKVYEFGALPNNAGKNIPLNINGLKEVTRVYGISTQGTAYIPLPLSSARGLTENIELYISGGNIVIYTGTSRSDYTKTTITVEYTKNTN